jgi:FixJ family two-component response regulator
VQTRGATNNAVADFKKTDLVIVDDDKLFADSLAFFFGNKVVDQYHDPLVFLEKLPQYAKDIVICLDNDFRGQMSGIEVSYLLHEAGFTRLYMLSGKSFEDSEIPDHLTAILKGDMDSLRKLFD